jgi:hypothetical protein
MLFALLALGGLCLALAVVLAFTLFCLRRALSALVAYEEACEAFKQACETYKALWEQRTTTEADWRDDVPPAEWWTVGE